jgi:aspartate aminotransferase
LSTELTRRVQTIKPSATIAVSSRAAELKAAGRDIVSLGAGEPDFDTPEHIKQAAVAAMNAGQTRYTAVDGTAELKQAVIGKLNRDNQLEYSPGQIIVSSGAKHSIFNMLLAVIQHDDEVIIPAPFWVSYPDMTRLVDGTPVIVPTSADQKFKLTPEALEAAITPRTRLLVINSPSNPTGQVYSRTELEALGEVLRRHPRVLVMSDDIYEHIYWGADKLCFLPNACPDLKDRVLVVNGVSKGFAMTGWRIGYAAGPEWLIGAMKKIQSQSTSNPCSVSQAAAAAALNGDMDCVKDMGIAYKTRHDYITAALDQLPGVSCLSGEGAFYAFPDFGKYMASHGFDDDVALAADILDRAEVALVPGSAFGAPGHLRASYATSMEQLEEAIRRLGDYLG